MHYFDLVAKNCPICGKEFFPPYNWAYKEGNTYFCSWKCLRINEEKNKKKEKTKYKHKKVEQLTLEGELVRRFDSAELAAEAVDGVYQGITKACRSDKESYKGYKWRYYNDEMSEMRK